MLPSAARLAHGPVSVPRFCRLCPIAVSSTMPGAICIVYRHRYGCPRGACPNHLAVIRNRADADRTIETLSKSHPESPVEIVRVQEV